MRSAIGSHHVLKGWKDVCILLLLVYMLDIYYYYIYILLSMYSDGYFYTSSNNRTFNLIYEGELCLLRAAICLWFGLRFSFGNHSRGVCLLVILGAYC